MSLFSKLTTALLPRLYGYYPNQLHPKAALFVSRIQAKQYAQAENLFRNQSKNERTYLLEAVSDMVTQDAFFDDWFDKSNGPPLSCLFRGALMTQRAWHYRGAGRGSELKDENVTLMHEALGKAYNSFAPIIGDPDLGQDAAAKTIRVLMGAGARWEQIDEMLLVLRAYPTPHLLGEINYLIASCKKWYGSHKKMHSFAANAIHEYANHPEIGALSAVAHWERQLYYDAFDKDTAGSEAYMNNTDILDVVKSHSERLLKHKSSLTAHAVIAHNAFAAFFCDRSEWDLAKPHFKKMKLRVCSYPWSAYQDSYLNQVYSFSMW